MWLHNVVITLKCCKETWPISHDEHMKPSTSYYIDVLSILQNSEQNVVEPVVGLVGLHLMCYQHVFGEVIMVNLTPQTEVFTSLFSMSFDT